MNHVFAAEPNAESKPDEQFRMRRTAGNPARLLFIEALGQLHPLLRIGASRMQRAQRPRKLTHLQKKLGRKITQPILRNLALCDPMPNGMAPKGPPLMNHRKNLAHKAVIRRHGETSCRESTRGAG